MYANYTAEKPDFDQYLKTVFGNDLDAFLNHPELSDFIRVNTMRASTEQVEAVLSDYGFETERVAGLNDALRIKKSPYDPTLTLHHFAGWYVKQSLSSQLPVRFLDAQPGHTVIDLCAAPGSKTTQIASSMHNEGRLYANDLAGKRMTPLAGRLDANCVSHCVLFNKPAERLTQILPPVFDRVLADVPCSGLGNRDTLDENRNRWAHAKSPLAMNQLQYRIALTGCKLLKKGGRMVYSTCSLDPLEDEAVVNELISRLPMKMVDVLNIEGLVWRHGLTEYGGQQFHPDVEKARRVTPWENDTQGFFVAVLEKTDDLPLRFAHEDPCVPRVPILNAQDEQVAPILENIHKYYGIEPSVFKDYHFIMSAKAIHCIDAHWESIETGFQRAGLCLAKKRGGIWRLSHAMIQTLSPYISKNIVHLSAEQLRQIAMSEDGKLKISALPESPYPVISSDETGCIATSYDISDRSAYTGMIFWKRPNVFHCL